MDKKHAELDLAFLTWKSDVFTNTQQGCFQATCFIFNMIPKMCDCQFFGTSSKPVSLPELPVKPAKGCFIYNINSTCRQSMPE